MFALPYRVLIRNSSTFKRLVSKSVEIELPNGLKYSQPTGIFINNEFYQTEKTVEVENPSTNEVITRVSIANSDDVDYAVDSAERAFNNHWGTSDPSYRAKLLHKIANRIEEQKDLMASIESFDNGKTLALAAADVRLSVDYFRSIAGFADKLDGRSISNLHDEYVNFTSREPFGVVAGLIPWNFPLLMLTWKLAPALVTGNTAILKPASATPLNALIFAQICKDVGLPDGVVNILPGSGSVCGEAILNHPKIRKVAFTGSTEVGKNVMVKAAQSNLKKVSLELGGKSPNIVFDDCDVPKTLNNLVKGIFANAGQICSSGSRIYIQDTIYEEFLQKFKEHIETNIKIGDPFNSENFQGAITNKQQFETILKYIDIGKESGAKILTGGKRIGTKGYFVEPTVFYDVDETARIVQEEIFGPVAVVSKFSTIEEVVQKANNSEYGLGAGIQTTNINNALKVAKKLKAGTVWVNTYNDFDLNVPFGGFKQSGFGRDMGKEALDDYLQVKSVRIKLD